MAFDAGMLAASVAEIDRRTTSYRVDRISQPSRDEVVLTLHGRGENCRLLINAGPNSPRIGISHTAADNPDKPPVFCLLLRKHLLGARLSEVKQQGFERAAELTFAARDEMGFSCTRILIAEVMGKYSNLILCDGDRKIISALKIVDFTTSSKRQVLPGMTYEIPPAQDKLNPLESDRETFMKAFFAFPPERTAEKFICATYLGISATTAREIAFRATRHTDTPLSYCDPETLFTEFSKVVGMIKSREFMPTLVTLEGRPAEYSFMPLLQYGDAATKSFDSVGELLDTFFSERDREQRTRQRASDLLRLMTNAEARISKKLAAQRSELDECAKGASYREIGDLITANIYRLRRGDREVTLTDYSRQNEDGSFPEVRVELDSRLTPAANAQRYYKKYAKSKTAQTELTKQIKLGEAELEYIYSVFDALTHAETVADLSEIRDELYRSGYALKMRSHAVSKKPPKPTVAKFLTSGGYTVYCGKNNLQNEYVTFRLAEKTDWWFHAKGTQGSHVLLASRGEEPDVKDFTEAAMIAAYYSRAGEGASVEVDYMKAGNVKKPANGKPGLVIYHSNWSCTVTPDAEKIQKMRVN